MMTIDRGISTHLLHVDQLFSIAFQTLDLLDQALLQAVARKRLHLGWPQGNPPRGTRTEDRLLRRLYTRSLRNLPFPCQNRHL